MNITEFNKQNSNEIAILIKKLGINESQNLVNDLISKLSNHTLSQFISNEKAILVGNRLIKKFKKQKKLESSLIKLDHELAKLRKELNKRKIFKVKPNKINFKKWKMYEFDEDIFINYPEFANYLHQSNLLGQIKVTRDKIRLIENQPAILVNSHWMTFDIFKNSFKVQHDAALRENFICNAVTDEIYTYLDTGAGLVPHHPYKAGLDHEISYLSLEDYQKTLRCARLFVRAEESNLPQEELQIRQNQRNYILQICTSYIDRGNDSHPIKGNFNKFMQKIKHPWLRLIDQEGKVFEMGFVGNVSGFQFLKTGQGHFRSPDIWAYPHTSERIITNIAITKEEAEKLREFTREFLQETDPIAFNFLRQNCALFTRIAVKYATEINIPTQISFFNWLGKISPEFLCKVSRVTHKLLRKIREAITHVTPSIINRTVKKYVLEKLNLLWDATIAFRLSLLAAIFGGFNGEKGVSFETHKMVGPILKKPKYWYDLSFWQFNLPAILQEIGNANNLLLWSLRIQIKLQLSLNKNFFYFKLIYKKFKRIFGFDLRYYECLSNEYNFFCTIDRKLPI